MAAPINQHGSPAVRWDLADLELMVLAGRVFLVATLGWVTRTWDMGPVESG